jgi:hypothetical protein
MNPYAPPKSELAEPNASTTPRTAPALWNPGAAAGWSLLFSPIFGSLVHMKNWQALGDAGRAAQSKNWAIGSLVALLLSLVVAFVLPESPAVDLLMRAVGFGVLVAWYYSAGKEQVMHVKGAFGTTYPRRGWAQPLLLAVGAVVVLMAGVVLLAVLGV